MPTIKQRIPHRRRHQIFRDHGYAAIDAALRAEQENALTLWLKRIKHDLIGAFRKLSWH